MVFIKKRLPSILLLFLILSPVLSAQITSEQVNRLQQMSAELSRDFEIEKARAVKLADSIGFPVRQEFEDGRVIELMRFKNGRPVYYETFNAEGAELINTDEVYSGGAAGLSLSGTGQIIGLWDAGIPLLSHQEISGRVTVKDGTITEITHATRVAGTLIAAGVNTDAKGMSFSANLDSYHFNNDLATMASAASGGLLVSVHPYGYPAGWSEGMFNGSDSGWYWWGDIAETESGLFGLYDDEAESWDQLGYNAPNYLIVVPAGNNRGEGPASGAEHWAFDNDTEAWVFIEEDEIIRESDGGANGFDSMSSFSLSKNVVTVGAVDGTKDMWTSSGWGPADDGRIKPDVVAKGVGVFSSSVGSTSSYSTSSGTSYSSPMIAGSAGLLLEHQENLNPGATLLSSTLKGLIIHTAEDLGRPGPDYEFGWGLMNTRDAAELMSANTNYGIHIKELTINDGEELYINVKANGTEPLRATIAWTDPPGTPPEYAVNPADLMLANDLDMRIFSSSLTEFQPYILDPANPSNNAVTGDNFRDNVELVHITNPVPGEIYTIKISHKNTLENGSQDFSLIITGNEAETYTLQIESGEGEGWRFLSSPLNTTYAEFLNPIWTQGPDNSNFPSESVDPSVLFYNGSVYEMPADLEDPLQPGNGIAVFMYDDDDLDENPDWPKNLSITGMESISPFYQNTSNGLNAGNNVFSLLGNPFHSAIEFGEFEATEIGGVVYVYDHSCDSFSSPDEDGGDSGGCFRAWNGGAGSLTGGRIAPFQGFFVFATGNNPELTIPESAKTDTPTEFYKEKETGPVVQFAARLNGRHTADTWFSFTGIGSLERNKFDAPYLYPLDYSPFLSMHSETEAQAFNIKNLPLEFDDPLHIPIHIDGWAPNGNDNEPGYNPMSGQVEMIWPEIRNFPGDWTLSLTDNKTGDVINMHIAERYWFELDAPAGKVAESLLYEMKTEPVLVQSVGNARFTMSIYPFATDRPFVTEVPDQLTLGQNYPNPFNPSTLIRYELPSEAIVTLDVFSIEGQRVATLVNSVQSAGSHTVNFDASNFASGLYLYRLTAGNMMLTRKMVLIK